MAGTAAQETRPPGELFCVSWFFAAKEARKMHGTYCGNVVNTPAWVVGGKWTQLGHHFASRFALTPCAGETAERKAKRAKHTAPHHTKPSICTCFPRHICHNILGSLDRGGESLRCIFTRYERKGGGNVAALRHSCAGGKTWGTR